jgi:hypothetical protein
MKIKNIIITVSIFAYSYLFYNQSPGLNSLLFTLVLTIGICIINKALLQKTTGKLLLAGSMLSSLSVALFGNELAFLIFIGSLTLVSVQSIAPTSLITGGLHGIYSYLTSWKTLLQDWLLNNQQDRKSRPFLSKLTIVGIPVLITIIFFFLYRSSNSVFYNYTKNWNFDFISLRWILFTLVGLLLIYGFYKPKIISIVQNIEGSMKSDIEKNSSLPNTLLGKEISLNNEYLTGTVLLVLLNILILFVNILDSNYLLFDKGVSEVNLSANVHEGIGILIFSLLMAIAIILFFLRNQLNFYKPKTFIYLAYTWIVQNILLVLTTAGKNGIYIHEYGLTHLRIGVYIILILATIGLIFTFVKIAKAKTTWYLICDNAWTLYCVLLLSTFFNWGAIITSFNLNWSKENNKPIDLLYLAKHCENNIPGLISISNNLSALNATESEKKEFLSKLENRIKFFKTCYKYTDWQSLNYQQYITQELLKETE